jgi:hypothetical protein
LGSSAPTEACADAENRIEQVLRQSEHGDFSKKNRKLIRRAVAASKYEWMQLYGTRIEEASKRLDGPERFVPGEDIAGDSLRNVSNVPILCGSLVCQLCQHTFIYEADFRRHQACDHGGEVEYRKRVLYLLAEAGCRRIAGQEKRIMGQNFAHFQQFSGPGAGSNYFANVQEVPRSETACAICAQKDWREHRFKLNLFSACPDDEGATEAADLNPNSDEECHSDKENHQERERAILLLRRGVYYVQSPEKVNKLLNLNRYSERWLLIPTEELHASSVQHPEHSQWRWLLHSRRVPVLGDTNVVGSSAAQFAMGDGGEEERPACAGIGDPDSTVQACWDCIASLGARNPRMPSCGLTNDNWIGREKKHVRVATSATKMLASIARCCYKQVRLGKGSPDALQKCICGNTIFFAQPAAEVPSLILAPEDSALADTHFNAIFTRSVDDLSKAQWATVNRDEYLRIVMERKEECALFAKVYIDGRPPKAVCWSGAYPSRYKLALSEWTAWTTHR